ncbi:hypothetical protein GCM10027034_42120 [Ramlibacter solisilvae]|uniref:Uncharacterized protein n=1 Tax=Ramlibacter tataouinensis TaxID=94132 RepID=A0A127JZJ1_9BURK|nr:hypothetical protein [Ramlibacter tataouinensis]AMO25381.1 hypothetical protein UC35_10810 [Ramlibacter tataouinensis]
MTSFAHVDYPAQHPGVERAERVVGSVKQLARGFDGARTAATLLLSAIVAALLVVANQVVDTWTEGHLLVAWIAMWTVAFAALALLAAPARHAAALARGAVKAWNAARRQAAADAQYWQAALADARIMADISRAMSAAAVRDIRAYY